MSIISAPMPLRIFRPLAVQHDAKLARFGPSMFADSRSHWLAWAICDWLMTRLNMSKLPMIATGRSPIVQLGLRNASCSEYSALEMTNDIAITLAQAAEYLKDSARAERAFAAGLQPAQPRWRTSSASILRRSPLLLIYHSGSWCPGCNLSLRAARRGPPINRGT
jgi:hypothetical protein